MQDKQKVTFYISPELHYRLKVKAAVDVSSMSDIVEKAVDFYIHHPEIIDEVEAAQRNSYKVHQCPECSSSVVLKDGQLVTLGHQPTVVTEELPMDQVNNPNNEELVPC